MCLRVALSWYCISGTLSNGSLCECDLSIEGRSLSCSSTTTRSGSTQFPLLSQVACISYTGLLVCGQCAQCRLDLVEGWSESPLARISGLRSRDKTSYNHDIQGPPSSFPYAALSPPLLTRPSILRWVRSTRQVMRRVTFPSTPSSSIRAHI